MNIQKILQNLEANNMQAYYVETKEEVIPLLDQLIPDGVCVAVGGSVTLSETGVIDYLRGRKVDFLDRHAKGITPEQARKIYQDSFSVHTYLTSTNALTEQGELYNVDGTGNRIAAIEYGPESVIVVCGINKIVPDLAAAIHRVKTIAAPKNCVRLNCDTYCQKTGHCVSLNQDNPAMTDGCNSDARICCQYSICGRQRYKNRIKVILVNEELGY